MYICILSFSIFIHPVGQPVAIQAAGLAAGVQLEGRRWERRGEHVRKGLGQQALPFRNSGPLAGVVPGVAARREDLYRSIAVRPERLCSQLCGLWLRILYCVNLDRATAVRETASR